MADAMTEPHSVGVHRQCDTSKSCRIESKASNRPHRRGTTRVARAVKVARMSPRQGSNEMDDARRTFERDVTWCVAFLAWR
jgi:hypothetical protein